MATRFTTGRRLQAMRPCPSSIYSLLTSRSVPLRLYATANSSLPTQPKIPTVIDSASQIAAHLAEHPEKLDYMIKVVSQQLSGIKQEMEQKDGDFEPAEAAAVLNALESTVNTLLPGVVQTEKKDRLQSLVHEISKLRDTL